MIYDFLYLGLALLVAFIVVAIAIKIGGYDKQQKETPRQKWTKIVFLVIAGFLLIIAALAGAYMQLTGFNGSYMLGQQHYGYGQYDLRSFLAFFYIVSQVPFILKILIFLAGLGILIYGIRLQRKENSKNWPGLRS